MKLVLCLLIVLLASNGCVNGKLNCQINDTVSTQIKSEKIAKKENICIDILSQDSTQLRITSLVKDYLTGYTVPCLTDFNIEWCNFTENETPYFIKSDFNGDKFDDYGILLKKENSRIVSLFAIMSNERKKIMKIEDFRYNLPKISIVLNIQEKGIWQSATQTITIPFNGITVDFFEESISFSYYWKNDKFNKFLYD